MSRLNLTNGTCFNEVLSRRLPLERCVAFCEAMMMGEAADDLFSEPFCRLRAASLGVPLFEYQKNLAPFLQETARLSDRDEVVLWFGTDTFCQLNLLTVLAYLETLRFSGSVFCVLLDDRTETILREPFLVTLGPYRDLYRTVLLRRQPAFLDPISQEAVLRWLDFLSPDGELARIVRAHPEEDEDALCRRLLKEGSATGIGDLQAYQLIRSVRGG